MAFIRRKEVGKVQEEWKRIGWEVYGLGQIFCIKMTSQCAIYFLHYSRYSNVLSAYAYSVNTVECTVRIHFK